MGNDRAPAGVPVVDGVDLHPTRQGLLTTWVSGVVILGVAVLAALFGDGVVGPVLIGLVGLAALVWVAWDVPVRVEVRADGITRVCLLRRQLLPWDELVAVERVSRRPPPKLRGSGGDDDGDETSRAAKERRALKRGAKGGLVARGTERRSWQLTDRAEGHAQFEALRRSIERFAEATQLRAAPPPRARRDSRPLLSRQR